MATVTINISKLLTPPSAILRFQGGFSSLTQSGVQYVANLDASASNSIDGSIISYIWEYKKDSGNWIQIRSTTSPFTQHTVSLTGIYKFRVKVVDTNSNESYSNEITLNFTRVAATNCDAWANGVNFTTNFTYYLGGSFFLDASDSIAGDIGDTIISYAWEITAQPVGANASITNVSAQKTTTTNLNVVGLYSVLLEIVSSNGTTDNVLIRIDVKNQDENGNYF